MAYFHISGRPKPRRVSAAMDPEEAAGSQVAELTTTARARATTVLIAVVREPGRSPIYLWPALACLGIGVVAAVIYFSPGLTRTGPQARTKLVEPKKPSFFSSSKPVLPQAEWTYGRSGSPPAQSLPSAETVERYASQMETLGEQQAEVLSAIPRAGTTGTATP